MSDHTKTAPDTFKALAQDIADRFDEMEKKAEARAGTLLAAFEKAVASVLAVHEDDRQVRAELADALGRITAIEMLCPECPRRPALTTPPPGSDGL